MEPQPGLVDQFIRRDGEAIGQGGKIDSFLIGTSAREVTPKVKAITAALAISVLVLVISRLLS